MLEIPGLTLSERDLDDLPPALLLDRRSLQGQCNVAAMCTVSLAYARAAGVKQLGAALVDIAAVHAPKVGKSLWDFLNKPFIATVVGSGLSGFGVMVVNNKWSPGKEEPGQCSSVGSEADVLKGSIKEATYFADLEAVELVLTLQDGRTSTILSRSPRPETSLNVAFLRLETKRDCLAVWDAVWDGTTVDESQQGSSIVMIGCVIQSLVRTVSLYIYHGCLFQETHC